MELQQFRLCFAGYLIERITGQSYEKFVQENIFTPLGMKDSGYDFNSAIIPHRAAGYVPSPAGPIHAGFIHMTCPMRQGRDIPPPRICCVGNKDFSAADC